MINPNPTNQLLKPIVETYAKRLRSHGPNAQGVLWRNQEWQLKRYSILLKAINIDDPLETIKIADFGCGYGALWDYLSTLHFFDNVSYIGYDICPEMITYCRNRIITPKASFIHSCNVTEDADYIFASGTYNLKATAENSDWWAYVTTSIEQVWSKTKKTLGFNMLRIDCGTHFDSLYYANPETIYNFCYDRLSHKLEYLPNHPLPDMTFFVHR